MNKFNFLWIDDDLQKIEDYRGVIEHGAPPNPEGAVIQAFKATSTLLSSLEQISNAEKPDLIIIDHVFSRVKLPFGIKGSSVAHLLRTNWPDVPMVCVTGAENTSSTKKIDQEDYSEYTQLFDYLHLGNYIDQIYVIAKDFPKIKIKTRSFRESLAVLLNVPSSEKSLFLKVLPAEFGGVRFPTTQHRVAYWIINSLLRKPGFLWDRLRVATYLGLNEQGFGKVSHLFDSARYRGLFSIDSSPLWWVSELQSILTTMPDSEKFGSSQLMGRALPGIDQTTDHSSCYVSGIPEEIPDVVAKIAANQEKAVCSKYTVTDPAFKEITPGFDTPLLIANR
jgi:CheY-like chemotaxis protein